MFQSTAIEENSIKNAVINFLQKDKWNFEENDNCIRLEYISEKTAYDCFLDIYGSDTLIIYTYTCIKIPIEKRLYISEYITRANFGLIFGNFEMSFSNGMIRYRTSIGLLNADLSYETIGQLLWENLHTIDKYFPGIMMVLYGNISPENAINQIEDIDNQDAIVVADNN